MIKRLTAVAIGVAFAMSATVAEARPYYGFDGRNYGELPASPNYGRPTQPASLATGPIRDEPGVSRSCLTKAAHALLDRIEAQFGRVRVISTCRPGATIAGTGRISRHASGNAIDFDAGSKKGAIVSWLIANHHTGGTMTYSDMSHIHADVGPHFVALGANSHTGGGGRRTYASRGDGYEGARHGRGYGRGRGYARYDADYEPRGYGRGRGYARYAANYEPRGGRSRSYGYADGRSGDNQGYRSGYATIYR